MAAEKFKATLKYTIYMDAEFHGEDSDLDNINQEIAEHIASKLQGEDLSVKHEGKYVLRADTDVEVDIQAKTITAWFECTPETTFEMTREEFYRYFNNDKTNKDFLARVTELINEGIGDTIFDELPNAYLIYYKRNLYAQIDYCQSKVEFDYKKTEALVEPSDYEQFIDDIYYML